MYAARIVMFGTVALATVLVFFTDADARRKSPANQWLCYCRCQSNETNRDGTPVASRSSEIQSEVACGQIVGHACGIPGSGGVIFVGEYNSCGTMESPIASTPVRPMPPKPGTITPESIRPPATR
jgi:hypothetical protein